MVWCEAHVAVAQTLVETLVCLSRVKSSLGLRCFAGGRRRDEQVLREATSEEAKLLLLTSTCIQMRQSPWRNGKERCSRRFCFKCFLAAIGDVSYILAGEGIESLIHGRVLPYTFFDALGKIQSLAEVCVLLRVE